MSSASTAPFAYDLAARPTRYRFTEDQLLTALRAFLATKPRKPTVKAFNAWPLRPCNALILARRLGGWPVALERAGFHNARRRAYSPQELIDRLDAAWRTLGFPPGPRTLPRLANVTDRPYRDHWGSIHTACRRLAQYRQGHITRDELLRATPPPQLRRNIPNALRYQVLARDRFRCVLCGANPADNPTVILEIDHRHPHSKGGHTTPENLQTTCRPCNRGKRDRPPPKGEVSPRPAATEGAPSSRSSLRRLRSPRAHTNTNSRGPQAP